MNDFVKGALYALGQTNKTSYCAVENKKIGTRYVFRKPTEKEVKEIKSPCVGSLISIHAKAGDRVAQNDIIATIEIMKFENPILMPEDGIIIDVLHTGNAIEHGQRVASYCRIDSRGESE